MTAFKFKLIQTTTFKGVVIDLYSSTEGYFVETSQGLVSEYYKTKKEIKDCIKVLKNNI